MSNYTRWSSLGGALGAARMQRAPFEGCCQAWENPSTRIRHARRSMVVGKSLTDFWALLALRSRHLLGPSSTRFLLRRSDWVFSLFLRRPLRLSPLFFLHPPSRASSPLPLLPLFSALPSPRSPLLFSQPKVILIDSDKLTLHGLSQYYIKLEESQKTRKLTDLMDILGTHRSPSKKSF